MATATLPTPLLSPVETAELLGTTAATLAVWRCTRRFPGLKYIKVGKSVRYRLADVQAFIDRQTIGSDQ